MNAEPTISAAEAGTGLAAKISPYVQIARPDHWFKNVFMLAGVVLAAFYVADPAAVAGSAVPVLLGLAATCLVASSNYVINEVLDAPTDRLHPEKRNRPVPSGRVSIPLAYAEWLALAAVGLAGAWLVNEAFFASAAALWVMGLVYNVRPVRSKELPYVDVLSESVNNPLRLLLGWFALLPPLVPPVSLLVAYWMSGAFFMASKRLAEYRAIGDPEVAAGYRKSFAYYDESRLLVSMFFYACFAALMLGIFVIRYKLELILWLPLVAGFFGYFLQLTLQDASPVQSPERLYRERGFMSYLALCAVCFFTLMFVEIPALYELFNVEPSRVPTLWKF